MPIRIGIDVGERSVGFATVEYDDDGWPIEILNSVAHIHDGGMDPGTGKTPQSRLATAGVARRTRRLIRNRRKRLQRLDRVLQQHGFPVPTDELPQTHGAWLARAHLIDNRMTNAVERDELISLAVRHVARHRGWRNPWWSVERLAQAPTPTESFLQTLDTAKTNYPDKDMNARTMGELVSRIVGTGAPIRPTLKSQDTTVGALMATQVRQEDSLFELRLIFETQQVPGAVADSICAAVFSQTKPHIPKDRIGRCALQPDQLRAPLASLEFQEFRIRDAVANLRVGREKRTLTECEHDIAVEMLTSWRDDIRPRWRDIAEKLDMSARDLVDSSLDGSGGSHAPSDRTSAAVEVKFKKNSVVGAWWIAASAPERSELISIITDLSSEDGDMCSDSVQELLSQEAVLEPLAGLNEALESGRAAYSQETLDKLNSIMRDTRCDLHTARKVAFGVDDSWLPPQPSFNDAIEHPTVARVNTLVRRYLMNVVDKWGMPDHVIVEHVRGAFLGPSALAELKNEIRLNTFRRDGVAKLLRVQGIEHPGRTDIKRNECVERQNCVCLYCGSTITLMTCELDHIVPRAGGGSSRLDNLVAVCRSCNTAKGRQPFAVFAAHAHNEAISVHEAQLRVKAWQRVGMTIKSFARLKANVSRRLALSADDETDERSLESTAYAAREMRARIGTFLVEQGKRLDVPAGQVLVFSGAATSEARKAGRIDDRIRLRKMTRKSRFDRRHHAIDAVVLTSLNLGVAKTLKERSSLQRDNQFTGKDPGWKEYCGTSQGDQSAFGAWRERVGALAELLEAAIRQDDIPVVRQLRLTPRVGSVHADTIQRLVYKSIGDAFSQDEILRLVDRSLYMRLQEIADGGNLDVDDRRSELQRWAIERPVALFPTSAAYLPVRGGAVTIGGTIRYAQIYAWKARSGFNYGMVRLYVGEFPRIGFGGPGNNFLTTTPPAHSQAMRTANPVLRARIESGEARLIGWIAVDDEIEIEPTHFQTDDSRLGEFLTLFPERHWLITGITEPGKVGVAPSYLAYEGIVTAADVERSGTFAGRETPSAVSDVLKANRIPISVNVILGSPGCNVIRRTVLGRPRWTGDALPTSWNVRSAAEEAFAL